MPTRRNILTLLGLAGAATPAISSDDVAHTMFDGGNIGLRLQKYDPERMATALERLAAEVRSCDVSIERFHIGSEVIGEDWLKQTLTIDVAIQHKDKHVKEVS